MSIKIVYMDDLKWRGWCWSWYEPPTTTQAPSEKYTLGVQLVEEIDRISSYGLCSRHLIDSIISSIVIRFVSFRFDVAGDAWNGFNHRGHRPTNDVSRVPLY